MLLSIFLGSFFFFLVLLKLLNLTDSDFPECTSSYKLTDLIVFLEPPFFKGQFRILFVYVDEALY